MPKISRQNNSDDMRKTMILESPEKIEIENHKDFIDAAWKYVFPLIALLPIMAQSRFTAVVIALLFILFSLGKVPAANMRRRTTYLTVMVILYSALCLAAGLYSDFGGPAAKESAKILSALAIFSMVLMRAKNGDEKTILKTIAVICAVISFLCIDASSFKNFTKAYAALMKLLLYECDIEKMGYEQGIRITGIFCNANISAGIMAFGILISIYLAGKPNSAKKRFAAFVILGANSLGFLLSFSMGATAALFLACIAFIIASDKKNRFSLLLLMAETFVSTIAFSFAAIPFLGTSGTISAIPLMCCLLCGPFIWVLDRFAGQNLIKKLEGKDKAIGIACGILIAAVAVYAALALNITSAVTLSSGERLSRAEYLAPGEYDISAQIDNPAEIVIYSQNEAQLMMHTNTVLYNGKLNTAKFKVPEGSRVVWFAITAQDDTQIKKISLSDGTVLKLGYPLLPEIISNRLQGLFANQNFIQRLVFFRDGIKLFKQSPIIGSGLASVEGRLTSVQSFYYESVYIHNHFIQVLDEMGIVGLVVFVLMLLSAVILLQKSKRAQNERTMYAVLVACLVMMTAHSVTEVVWSTGMYQSVAFLLFSSIVLFYGDKAKEQTNKVAMGAVTAGVYVLIISFGAMIAGNLIAADKVRKFQPSDRASVISAMRKLELLDVYDDEFYKATYIQNALLADNYKEKSVAAKYARQLRATDEYRACTDVAMYYYLPKGMIEEMFDASRAALAQEASNPEAWNLQLDFYQQALAVLTERHMTEYIKGVMTTLNYLEDYNKGRMQEIEISEQNKPFADCVKNLAASGASNEDIYKALLPFAKR